MDEKYSVLTSSPAISVINTLADAGFETCFVGGCVRDCLRGVAPSDFDVATNARPDEVMRALSGFRIIETGLKHGTVTAIVSGEPVEITTYRSDGSYSDGRRPDSVQFVNSAEDDLSRRDFTVNAMAYFPDGRGLFDPFGGINDLDRGVIRCVGDPVLRFREDALRILRALRFASVLGFEIDSVTASAVLSERELLKKVSVERISSEFSKFLTGAHAGKLLIRFLDVFGVFIPELLPMRGCEQNNPYHAYDVLGHTAIAVDSAPPETAARLSALLHDIGKPHVRTQDEKGIHHFHGHAVISEQIACDVLSRLRCDNATASRVRLIVRIHDTKTGPDPKIIKRLLSQLGSDVFFDLLDMQRADISAQAPSLIGRLADTDKTEALARDILAEKTCLSLADLAVNGSDLLAIGCPSGPDIGRVLSALLDLVVDEKCENEREKLLDAAKNMW